LEEPVASCVKFADSLLTVIVAHHSTSSLDHTMAPLDRITRFGDSHDRFFLFFAHSH
jgi:hypothetical protein